MSRLRSGASRAPSFGRTDEPPASPVRSLADLRSLRDALKERAERERLDAARRREEEARRTREARLFRDAMSDAVPLPDSNRRDPSPPSVSAQALQFELDEQAALAQSLSDELDVERLLDTDAALSWRRTGIGPDVVRRLRRGQWVIQRQLDLHGLRVDEAREAVAGFLAGCLRKEIRCVRIVHGKGLGSKNREPVLKAKVQRWLVQRDEVLAFCQAGPTDGGSGAVIVLLRAA